MILLIIIMMIIIIVIVIIIMIIHQLVLDQLRIEFRHFFMYGISNLMTQVTSLKSCCCLAFYFFFSDFIFQY